MFAQLKDLCCRMKNDFNPTENRELLMRFDKKSGKIVFEKGEVSSEHGKVGKQIVKRLVEEGAHPAVVFCVESKIKYWIKSNFNCSNGKNGWISKLEFFHLAEDLQKVIKKLDTKSYIQKIAEEMKRHCYFNILMRMGINPFYGFDVKSFKYLQIIKDLEEKDVDLVTNCSGAVRYFIASILNEYEEEVLKKIDVKSGPDNCLKKLQELKEDSSCNQYVIDKLIAQAEVWKVMQGIPKMKNFPFSEIWRFCIDVEFQKFGAYIFENEPGYMIATLTALKFALGKKNLTHQDYIEINRLCGENLLPKLLNPQNEYSSFGLPVYGEMTGIVSSYRIRDYDIMDREGLDDLKEPRGGFFELVNDTVIVYNNPDEMFEMKFLFKHYDEMLSEATNQWERLMIHIWLSRELSLNHFFMDLNGRSSQIALINFIVHDDELPMHLLDTNPNLDTNGPVPFLKRILQAMRHYNKVCNNDDAVLSFEEVDEIINISKNPLWRPYHPTAEKRNAFYKSQDCEEMKKEEEVIRGKAKETKRDFWNTDYGYEKHEIKADLFHFNFLKIGLRYWPIFIVLLLGYRFLFS